MLLFCAKRARHRHEPRKKHMTQKFAERSLSEIATSLPGAATIFRHFNLDYCFAGDVSLSKAAAAKGLDLAGIESDLATLPPASGQPSEETGPLIERVVAEYHEVHRRELQLLQKLAEAVEKVHAGRPEVPVGLAAFLKRMTDELESHMQKEE